MARKRDVWNEVLSRITPPSNIAAYLEWSTGILRINATQEAWRRLFERGGDADLPPDEQELLETVTHEMFHVVQIINTGYLYQLVTQLQVEIDEWLRSCNPPAEDDDVVRAFLTMPVPPELSESVRGWIAELDTPGAEAITTRAIVESSAFLVQKRIFDHHFTHDAYLKTLDDSCPSPDYRHPYDVAARYLGNATVDAYPLVACLALCTLKPAEVLAPLCEEASRQQLISHSSGNTAMDIDGLIGLSRHFPSFVGTAAQLSEMLPLAHPVYARGVAVFKELAGTNQYAQWAFMCTPHLLWATLAEPLLRFHPLVFNDTRGRLTMIPPAAIRSQMTEQEQEQYALRLVATAAIYARIID